MHSLERQLLGNLLDCLDRLFDRESNVSDIHNLVFATAAALPYIAHTDIVDSAEKALLAILRSGASCDRQHGAALAATDELRKYLASVLTRPDVMC